MLFYMLKSRLLRLKLWSLLIIIVINMNVAYASVSTEYYEEPETGLGKVALSLTSTTDVLVKLMWAACILVGVGLLITAITQYQIHRSNPKLVPLATPITYLFLAIAAIVLPFAGNLSGFIDGYTGSGSGVPSQQQQMLNPEVKSISPNATRNYQESGAKKNSQPEDTGDPFLDIDSPVN